MPAPPPSSVGREWAVLRCLSSLAPPVWFTVVWLVSFRGCCTRWPTPAVCVWHCCARPHLAIHTMHGAGFVGTQFCLSALPKNTGTGRTLLPAARVRVRVRVIPLGEAEACTFPPALSFKGGGAQGRGTVRACNAVLRSLKLGESLGGRRAHLTPALNAPSDPLLPGLQGVPRPSTCTREDETTRTGLGRPSRASVRTTRQPGTSCGRP